MEFEIAISELKLAGKDLKSWQRKLNVSSLKKNYNSNRRNSNVGYIRIRKGVGGK